MKTPLPFLLFLLKTALVFSQTSLFDSLDITRQREVYFEFGKADLTAAADSAIADFSHLYNKESRPLQVRLTAHTDSIGSAKANLLLSQKRVEAVRNQLISNGLDSTKISFRFFGESQPAAANATEQGRQANRRATIDALFLKKMATVEGRVVDEKTGLGIPGATVVFRTKTAADSIKTDTAGHFSVRLPEGQSVGVETFAEGHFFESRGLKVGPHLPMLLVKLPPVEVGAALPIKNLYFVGNEATLLPTSMPALNNLLKFMRQSPGLKVEIAGHVNMPLQFARAAPAPAQKPAAAPSPDSPDRLMLLSVKRAETVHGFLEKNGIAPGRMTFKGYGNSQMAFPYAKNEEEQAANRRVEVRVLAVGGPR